MDEALKPWVAVGLQVIGEPEVYEVEDYPLALPPGADVDEPMDLVVGVPGG